MKTNLKVTNETSTSNQTPIEIALQIDENGMTTATKLYSFLELESKNFARWCRKNIINNKFATENIDYFPFVIQEERDKPKNPKPKTDYKLTSDFAKKLSMTGNTERHEQARQYFIACEQGLKIATEKIKYYSQIDYQPIMDSLSSIDSRLSALEKPTQKKQPPTNKYSRWKTNIFKNIKLIQEYVNDNSDENLTLAETMSTIFNEFQDKYNIDLSEYTEMYKCEYSLDSNSNIYTLDIINHYKDIRDTFTLTVNSIMEKLHIKNTDNNSSYNIFDTLAAQMEQ